MRQHHALFANFILRFGKEELIDYAETILIPALTDDTLVRKYGTRTAYRIYKGRVVRLDKDTANPTIAIIGQFIKQTELVRYQVFKRGEGAVPDEATLASAPSSFFVLMLNNHRLIYFPETPDAPDLTSFKATMKRFISDRHRDYIDELYTRAKDDGEPSTKMTLREQHEPPTLEIIPLTGKDSIAAFVNQFKVLKTIEFRIVKPNAELEGYEVFRQLREISDGLKSSDTRLRTSNPDGLDKTKSKKTINEATEQGNQEVTLDGVDQDGNKLKGNNDEFKISAPVSKVPVAKLTLAKRLFSIFEGLVAKGVIKVGPQSDTVTEVVNGLAE
jgi:hypothetical protein